MSCVAIEKLSKIFKSPKGGNIHAVSDLNLTIEDGELLVLVGPSGCGKSTTLRLIAGLEEINAGVISIDGRAINDVAAKDRDIAMVFQNHALYPHMTVYENMAFGLRLRKHTDSEIAERVGNAAGILGLKDCLDRQPRELSGGQRQRVAVGRAIVRQPKLFLFDEPLSNLDAQLRVQMRREISALHRRLGATMIYVTHDQVEAMTMGDRIAVMKDGVIQQVAAPMMLYDRPANLFVAGFIGSPAMNFFHGMVVQEGAGFFFQAAPSPQMNAPAFKLHIADATTTLIGKKCILGIRPEHISVYANEQNTPLGSMVEATIETIELLGAEAYLYATSGGQSIVAKTQTATFAKGKALFVFDMTRAHFFDPATGRAVVERI